MQLRKKSFLLRTVYFIFPLPALSFIAPKTMESPPARLPPVAPPLVYLIRHAHMFLVGCCVRCLQSVTIEDQVKFLFLIFSLLDASTQTIGPHPPTSSTLALSPCQNPFHHDHQCQLIVVCLESNGGHTRTCISLYLSMWFTLAPQTSKPTMMLPSMTTCA